MECEWRPSKQLSALTAKRMQELARGGSRGNRSQVDCVSLVEVAAATLQKFRGAVRKSAVGAAALAHWRCIQRVELHVGRGAHVVEEHAPPAAAAGQQVVQKGE